MLNLCRSNCDFVCQNWGRESRQRNNRKKIKEEEGRCNSSSSKMDKIEPKNTPSSWPSVFSPEAAFDLRPDSNVAALKKAKIIKCEKDRHSLQEEKGDGVSERSFSVRHSGYLEDRKNSAGRKKSISCKSSQSLFYDQLLPTQLSKHIAKLSRSNATGRYGMHVPELG